MPSGIRNSGSGYSLVFNKPGSHATEVVSHAMSQVTVGDCSDHMLCRRSRWETVQAWFRHMRK